MPLTSNLHLANNYYLLLVDIKKSTFYAEKERQWIFEQLEFKLNEINQNLNPIPALKLSISYGDEIAGLFETPVQIYTIINQLREVIYPVAKFRFAVSYGKIGIASQDIRKVGGEIFKQADRQIKRLKKHDGFCSWEIYDSTKNDVLNSLTEMSNAIIERMTPYQREVWQLLEQGMTQKEISELLNKYPQSVSEAVKRGGADLVIRASKIINELLVNT